VIRHNSYNSSNQIPLPLIPVGVPMSRLRILIQSKRSDKLRSTRLSVQCFFNVRPLGSLLAYSMVFINFICRLGLITYHNFNKLSSRLVCHNDYYLRSATVPVNPAGVYPVMTLKQLWAVRTQASVYPTGS